MKSSSPSNKKQRVLTSESEDTSSLAELTLRLELNGVDIKEATREIGTLWDSIEDDRIHPSRKNQIHQEGRKFDQNNNNKWDHQKWKIFNVASIESEMPPPSHLNNPPRDITTPDIKPILRGRIKGTRAKIYIDQGAEISVISNAFADANGINRTILRPPVKLQMANGIIEPALHMVHDVGFGWN